MVQLQRPLRSHLLLLLALLLVQQGVVVRATVTCQLHMEGYGHMTGLKSAHLACSGGMIKAAAHPMLAPFKRRFSGVQLTNTGGCGVGRRDCVLTICGDSAAVFEAATAVHVNVSTAAQSLVCLGAHSNITFQRARFHGNKARCISVPQHSSNSTKTQHSVHVHFNKCVFTDNHAIVDVGAVLALAGGTALVEASTFLGNSVKKRGGAIGVTNTAELTLVSSLLQNNTGKQQNGVDLLGKHCLRQHTVGCAVTACTQHSRS
jgi:predicted outer membrane repeat protein